MRVTSTISIPISVVSFLPIAKSLSSSEKKGQLSVLQEKDGSKSLGKTTRGSLIYRIEGHKELGLVTLFRGFILPNLFLPLVLVEGRER
jgi:hypothetical protein